MTEIRRCSMYDFTSWESLEKAFKEIHDAGLDKVLDKIKPLEKTRANKDYLHNEADRGEMKVDCVYMLARNKYGDFLSFIPETMKNIMPVRCQKALDKMPCKTKAQRLKRERAEREFISTLYFDKVVLRSNGEVNYLGRGYIYL